MIGNLDLGMFNQKISEVEIQAVIDTGLFVSVMSQLSFASVSGVAKS